MNMTPDTTWHQMTYPKNPARFRTPDNRIYLICRECLLERQNFEKMASGMRTERHRQAIKASRQRQKKMLQGTYMNWPRTSYSGYTYFIRTDTSCVNLGIVTLIIFVLLVVIKIWRTK